MGLAIDFFFFFKEGEWEKKKRDRKTKQKKKRKKERLVASWGTAKPTSADGFEPRTVDRNRQLVGRPRTDKVLGERDERCEQTAGGPSLGSDNGMERSGRVARAEVVRPQRTAC